MIYLIDGHNLIPNIPGLSLRDLDDEMRLVEMLRVFAGARRSQVEVFFDGAPPGHGGARNFGTVKAHFVRAGRTADDAILAALRSLGARAGEARVISSDRRVQAEARALRAGLVDSASFARELLQLQISARPSSPDPRELPPPADEVDEWLKLFKRKK